MLFEALREHLNMDGLKYEEGAKVDMDWVESVLDHFQERTPKPYIEVRETLLVLNYKYAVVEFGRV
jgi:hypothetical protein